MSYFSYVSLPFVLRWASLPPVLLNRSLVDLLFVVGWDLHPVENLVSSIVINLGELFSHLHVAIHSDNH